MFYLAKWISGMSTIPIHSNRRWSLNNIGLNCLDFGIPCTLLRYQYESIARLFGHRSALTSHKIPNYAASSGRSEQILTPCFIYDFRMDNACIVLLPRLNAFVCCIFAKTWNAMASLGILLPIDLAPAHVCNDLKGRCSIFLAAAAYWIPSNPNERIIWLHLKFKFNFFLYS